MWKKCSTKTGSNRKKGTRLTTIIFPSSVKTKTLFLSYRLFCTIPCNKLKQNCGHLSQGHSLVALPTKGTRRFPHICKYISSVTSLYQRCKMGQDRHLKRCNATKWTSTPTCRLSMTVNYIIAWETKALHGNNKTLASPRRYSCLGNLILKSQVTLSGPDFFFPLDRTEII